MPRMRRGVAVRKFKAMGSVNGMNLGGRVFYCEWKGNTAKGAKCYPKQYVTNIGERTIKHRKTGKTSKVMTADISTAGQLVNSPTPGGRGTAFKPKKRTSRIGAATKFCIREGKKPGTKAMGTCIRDYFKAHPGKGGKKKKK